MATVTVNTKTIIHSKTHLHDYHDCAAKGANSVFYYSNLVTASRCIATSKQKHPVIL